MDIVNFVCVLISVAMIIWMLVFDRRECYRDCNDFMKEVFPELLGCDVGQKITECSAELRNILDQAKVAHTMGKDKEGKYPRLPLEKFSINERHYAGEIHAVTNAFGSRKGYAIELRDETEHYQALLLKEHYNDELE